MDVKFCARCGELRPVAEFYVNRARYDGLSGYCITHQRQSDAEGRRRARARIVADLGGRCARCGYDVDIRALQIDHVLSDGAIERANLHNTGTAAFYDRVRANPERYALVCSNCNQILSDERGEKVGRRVYRRKLATVRKLGSGRWPSTTDRTPTV